ncbi:uncharacterized protein N7483_006174 [Penicillium malachiteum]|uniref:uncharacterized protein n=1 Tax=Penicillium malachiteum TaxID=1324776 RepID=UPI002547691A|nr:uncharacterized protein N7483_006174 [Penicillium malachiteum]KAJ5731666.1 hypothetical protein N7483_006174 [Penicillium malachiteum]
MYTHLLLLIPILWVGIQVTLKLGRAIFSPLKNIPGPFWTRFTSLWYFKQLYNGKFEHENIRLHQKYGPIVRIAPNQYSISDVSAIKTVYGSGSKFPKSAWYDGWKHPQQWTVFADRDIKRHSDTRKRFTSLYSMSSLVSYEPFVDRCIDIFFARLDEFATKKQSFNLGHWFQCYAFDVIGDITFGQRFGFLDRGEDIDGAISAVHNVMMYSALIGVYPEWHPLLFEPMSKLKSSGAAGRAYISKFVLEKISIQEHERKNTNDAMTETTGPQNFLSKMMQARDQNPEKITDYHLLIMGQSNVTAGSDTTAISLSGIMWYLLQNFEALDKLRQEIQEFTQQGRCSHEITFKETQEMPYLQAVMKEALRMHAATGLPMWRVVPEGGAQLSGRFFPAGTTVGVNSWVAHYDEQVFPNAQKFLPERWLEAETEPEKLKEMNQMYMPFGLGSRTCLGKHISILEMSKLIPRLVRDYDLTTLRKTMDTENYWFVKPTNFDVRVSLRRQGSLE